MQDCAPHFQNSHTGSKLQLYAFKAFALCDQQMVVVGHTKNNNLLTERRDFQKQH